MEELEACVLFPLLKQQETQRLRERNRIAKRASIQPTPNTAEATSQDLVPPLHPPQHPVSDDPTALPWPSSLDEDWPGFSGSLVDTLSPRQLSVSVSGISNPEPRPPPASSSSLTSDSNDFNNRPSRLFHIAARNGTTGILLSLIKSGADVNSRDCSGTTPLHIAVRF
ncbi:ankyrin repeat domain protein [Fusarium sp. NRRL 52700]|nr:ankyrin repeat domain protein [Fusarium sp. NRRL 52700]